MKKFILYFLLLSVPAFAYLTPIGSGAIWGNITGTLSNQTDLQTALNLKAPLASPLFTNWMGLYTATLPPTHVDTTAGENVAFISESWGISIEDDAGTHTGPINIAANSYYDNGTTKSNFNQVSTRLRLFAGGYFSFESAPAVAANTAQTFTEYFRADNSGTVTATTLVANTISGTAGQNYLQIVSDPNATGFINFSIGGISAPWRITNAGHFVSPNSDNTYDIGANGTTRPRTGYFGTSVVTPVLNSTAAQTTLNGSAGTAVCSQPFQGSSYKKVMCYLNGYSDTASVDYTFPTAFSQTPAISFSVVGATASVSTTQVAFASTTITGFVILEGY